MGPIDHGTIRTHGVPFQHTVPTGPIDNYRPSGAQEFGKDTPGFRAEAQELDKEALSRPFLNSLSGSCSFANGLGNIDRGQSSTTAENTTINDHRINICWLA